MQQHDVMRLLRIMAEARAKWTLAKRQFDRDHDLLMGRMLHEAARNMMSVEQVSAYSNLSPRKVRQLMRLHGLNPKSSRSLLQEQAAKALAENAALLGVKPDKMDLMSPLAYLPAGKELRVFLETERQSPVTELEEPEIIALDFDALVECFHKLAERGAASFTHRSGTTYEVRVDSLGGEPERWGLSRTSLDLVLGAEL